MLKSFIISYNLKNTYRVNTIIHSIKQLPILNRYLTFNLYEVPAFKTLGNIISVIWELFTLFFGKFLYMLFLVFLLSSLLSENYSSAFLNVLFFLTIIGGLLNTYMFNPTNDKYYALILMKMDAKNYTLSNYLYTLFKVIIGFLPFSFLFGLSSDVSLLTCFVIPVFIAAIKNIFNALNLYNYTRTGKIIDENHPPKFLWAIVIILLVLGYGLPVINLGIFDNLFLIIAIIFIIFSIICLKYIFNFNKYYEVYHLLLSDSNMNDIKLDTKEITKKGVLDYIDDKNKYISNKKGYAYFNDLFVKRHDKLLMRFSKKVSLVAIGIMIVLIILTMFMPELKLAINKNILYTLPTLTFVMYYVNSGQRIAQVLFMNCDAAMLTYGFYRSPKVILSLFKERLKSVVLINLLPSGVISICYVIILFITGGSSNMLDYILLLTAINAMSLFFSVHNLVIYYLLQPYNINSDIKSATYQFINTGTYIACYVLMDLSLPINIFGGSIIVFSIIYTIISLYLIYRYAPKTFKIHI